MLSHEDCPVKGQVLLSKVSDEYGRLAVWGEESGAKRSGRGSLDDTLRHEPSFQLIVLDILNDLVAVPLSAFTDNDNSSEHSRTVYEPSMQSDAHCPRVPDLPEVPDGVLSFNCPFCYSKLDLRQMQNRHLWK